MLRKKLVQLQEKPLTSEYKADGIESKMVCMFVSSVRLMYVYHAVNFKPLSVIRCVCLTADMSEHCSSFALFYVTELLRVCQQV
jgi:hypothetical protein